VIERFLRNEDVDLYELTTTAQEAGIALEMLVDMRNKLVDAYRTIVSMQV
jgi:flagellar hook-basal body complex protein FliE